MKKYLSEMTVKSLALSVAEVIRWTYGSVGLMLLIRGYWLPDLFMVCIGGLIFYSAIKCFDPLVQAFVDVITGEDEDVEDDEPAVETAGTVAAGTAKDESDEERI